MELGEVMHFAKKKKRVECRNNQSVGEREGREITKSNVKNSFKNRFKIIIVTWNINGIKRKNKFEKEWEYLRCFDVIILMETWIEAKDQEWFRRKLDEKGYNWEFLEAERKKRRGRARGGMLVGVRKELKAKVEMIRNKNVELGKIELKGVGYDRKKWVVVGAYVREDDDEMRGKIGKWAREEEKVVLVGDFNARIGARLLERIQEGGS